MSEKLTPKTQQIMEERFGCDTLLALATVEDGRPYVRTVDRFYEDGTFYIITYALSKKCSRSRGIRKLRCAASGLWGMGMRRIWDISLRKGTGR